jgi:uncharacterized protein YbjT (DUF2867 family)
MRVAVVGGTGVVGRHVVAALAAGGHEPSVLARSTGVDVATGEGLDRALSGAQAVVDAGNVATLRRRTAVRWFGASTRRLLSAEREAGVQHHVLLSVVGIDRVDSGYYAGKREQEQVALAGSVPVTVLRATQFHEFPGQLLERSGLGPLAVVPRMQVQPVAAAEVGAALAELALGPAVGRAPDLAGPEVHDLVELVRRVVRARGGRQRVVPLRVPGTAGRRMRDGGLLPEGPGRRGVVTFDQWLAAAGGQKRLSG